MKVKINLDTSFSLIPENYQDKLWMWLFAKQTEAKGMEGMERYCDLQFHKGTDVSGSIEAGDVVDLDGECTREICGYYIDIEDLDELSITAWPL